DNCNICVGYSWVYRRYIVGIVPFLYMAAGALSDSDIPSSVPRASLGSSTVETVLKAVFGFAGAIAMIMIVIGGFKYITSLGNAQNIAKAKDTILYAVIGLVVC